MATVYGARPAPRPSCRPQGPPRRAGRHAGSRPLPARDPAGRPAPASPHPDGPRLGRHHHARSPADERRARAYADSARAGVAEQIEAAPEDAQSLALHALSLAYLGRTAEAVREGERAVELLPVSQRTSFGVYLQELLARIYTMAGKPARAVERLEVVLAHPSLFSRDRLRIDPDFGALREHPEFRRAGGGLRSG